MTNRSALLCIALVAGLAAASPRSKAARAEFMRAHPCPATGATRGACPGWVVDHVFPLACGGRDAPENMAWQTAAAAKAKDAWELELCRGAGP